ncbi:hypothetical protein P3T76_003651 [Phytophthora citrophthora]|uniref:Uncharacterized protein n=1 Tax=Phytophthora citrophthora TaxID=4793 RepID=A0AAD9GVR3_9STRA|nr:hypothetical protein P3T76_003651 [Phytophthora citrophthora]
MEPNGRRKAPVLHALDPPIRDRARALQVLLFANTLVFADSAPNLEEAVADCSTATVVMHYPDAVLLDDCSDLVCRMRGVIAEQSIGEAEVLTWSATIRRAFDLPPEMPSSRKVNCETSAVLELVKRQSEQIDVLILQNKRLEDRLLAVEAHFHTHTDRQTASKQTSVDAP